MVSSSWDGDGFYQLASAEVWVALRPQHLRPRPQALQATLSNPRSLREEEKEMKTGKAKGDDTPLSTVPPDGWALGAAAGGSRGRGRA